MDYKYIEQLLDRYWAAETTQEEERILRAFFAQTDVPEHLACYRDLFVYENSERGRRLASPDFDERLCRLAGVTNGEEAGGEKPREVRARRVSFTQRLRPLMRAAAAVAVVMLLGTGAQHIFNRQNDQPAWDYNADTYKDSYNNPREAYEKLDDGIREIKAVLNTTVPDSGRADSLASMNGVNTND